MDQSERIWILISSRQLPKVFKNRAEGFAKRLH